MFVVDSMVGVLDTGEVACLSMKVLVCGAHLLVSTLEFGMHKASTFFEGESGIGAWCCLTESSPRDRPL